MEPLGRDDGCAIFAAFLQEVAGKEQDAVLNILSAFPLSFGEGKAGRNSGSRADAPMHNFISKS